ncbi:MAG: SDR family oxidoreductase [Sandaracinaceae bacterium]|nr:SDR family oxidoreductase [Sandaracinaceae bacterium]
MDLRGKRALVTGASSGIGTSFAKELAKQGASLVITARRKDRLESLAETLRKDHGVEVEVIAGDLGKPEGAKALWDATEGKGTHIDVLVNNAGFGTKKPFVEQSWDKTFEEMQLNLISLTELTKRFSQAMLARGAGHILNVASIGAYLPTPSMSTYGAGKAYVRNFSEGLAYELKDTGVRVCCLCPGATESEFADTAGLQLASWKKVAYMSSDRCARIGLSALFRGRRNIVSGFWNSAAMFMLRFVPRPMAAWLSATFL